MKPLLDQYAPIPCPKCRTKMTQTPSGDVIIDQCPSCGGMWFDALELEKVAANRKQADALDSNPGTVTNTGVARGALWCPRDQAALIKMTALRQPHIRYESCTVCGGAFLDAGELRDLAHLTLAERLRHMFS